MRKIKKKYKNPRMAWDVNEIEKNREIASKYGLRNKREILMAMGVLRGFRGRAKGLIATLDEEKRKNLINRVSRLGLLKKNATLDDILALSVNDLLERRLQSIVFRKGFAKTIRQARQMITHGHVEINGRRIKYPSYLVYANEEDSIKILKSHTAKKQTPAVQEAKDG